MTHQSLIYKTESKINRDLVEGSVEFDIRDKESLEYVEPI